MFNETMEDAAAESGHAETQEDARPSFYRQISRKNERDAGGTDRYNKT